MPDLIDQLVDAQTENDAADLAEITSNKMSDEDKELVDSGISLISWSTHRRRTTPPTWPKSPLTR